MTERPDSERPRDEDQDAGAVPPPYPGWSAEQPPRTGADEQTRSGWTAPGQQPPAGSAPSGSAPGRPESSWTTPDQQQAGWTAPDQSGTAGWGAPPGAGPPPPGAPPPGGWGAGPAWSWPQPTVKPGVIPLRPLGVGEILDGAVTTIRQYPRPMLGLSAIVAIFLQLLGLVMVAILFSYIEVLEELPEEPTVEQLIGATAGLFGSLSILGFVSWLASLILTGILTVVVGRAVIGQQLTVAEAWRHARKRLLRLIALTITYTFIWSAPLTAVVLLSFVLIAAGGGAEVAVLAVLLGFLAVVLAVWLYVRYSLAVPALMLESVAAPHHHAERSGPRPIGLGLALRRSAELVTRSWWRVFGILLLVWLVVAIVANVVAFLFSIPSYFVGDPFDLLNPTTLGALTISTLGSIVSTTITAPFLASAVVLLYVDRRIRREALDIDLARAAGVTIPGRSDRPPPPGP